MAKSVTRLALLMARAAAFAVAVPLRRSFLPAAGERVEAPLAGHALQRLGAAILEREAGTGNEILDGLRHEHFAGAGLRGDARADVDGESGHLVADDLALTSVDAGPNLDPVFAQRAGNGVGAANRAHRSVEGREEAVPGGIELASPEAVEQAADDGMMLAERVRPRVVSVSHRTLG